MPILPDMNPVVSEKHERTIRLTLNRHELQDALVKLALRQAGVDGILLEASKIDVRFEDETEGSPAYRVGTKATVTITEDLGSIGLVNDPHR